jgi:ribonuclease HII
MLDHERRYERRGKSVVIGVDEAGRGPLAGPVVAAAVWLKNYEFGCRIDDSKKMSAAQRVLAYDSISSNALWGVGIVNERVIDRVNIRVATRYAMEEAVRQVSSRMGGVDPAKVQVIVDGNMNIETGYDSCAIIKGDSLSLSIAAASIFAKVTRDRIMEIYHRVFPQYGFSQHKGYPTEGHRAAIGRYGMSVIHRASFCGGK